MSYCKKCGKELREGAKFCNKCGAVVPETKAEEKSIEEVKTTEKEKVGVVREKVYSGKIHKCPNCGEILEKFSVYCPSCGKEIPKEVEVSVISELVETINALDEEKKNELLDLSRKKFISQDNLRKKQKEIENIFEMKKTNLIQSFPIPNSIEGIFEFMILATSNFNAGEYVKNLDIKDVSDAWFAKIEQAYKKASVLFSGTPRFAQIKEMYDKVIAEKDAVERQINNRKRIGALIGIAGGFVLAILIAIIVIVSTRPVAIGKSDEQLVGQPLNAVTSYFEERGFKNIKILSTHDNVNGYDVGDVVSVAIDGEFDFDEGDKFKKKTQIEITYIVKDITMSVNASDLKGKNYNDVIALLKEMGFTSISVVEEKDVTLGWINSVGDVKSVQINGNKDFESGDVFLSDATVVVTYHGKK
ncbi:MAG: zinc ribbon domain-containing protein [Clostridia bacterium]|nr:zinc ribbon domain-containing protein [Clostridia bacterium]